MIIMRTNNRTVQEYINLMLKKSLSGGTINTPKHTRWSTIVNQHQLMFINQTKHPPKQPKKGKNAYINTPFHGIVNRR